MTKTTNVVDSRGRWPQRLITGAGWLFVAVGMFPLMTGSAKTLAVGAGLLFVELIVRKER